MRPCALIQVERPRPSTADIQREVRVRAVLSAARRAGMLRGEKREYRDREKRECDGDADAKKETESET